MQEIEPIFATMFFIYFQIICMIFLTNIFLGLVSSNFRAEMELIVLEKRFSGKITQWLTSSYSIIKQYYKLRKRQSRESGKPVSCFWRLIPTPGWILSILDAIFDPENVEEEE